MFLFNAALSPFAFSAHWRLFGKVNVDFRKMLTTKIDGAVFFLKFTDKLAWWVHGVLCIARLLATLLFIVLMATVKGQRRCLSPMGESGKPVIEKNRL